MSLGISRLHIATASIKAETAKSRLLIAAVAEVLRKSEVDTFLGRK
jgi:hypothetical protein